MKWYALTDAPLKIYGLAVKEGMDYFRLPLRCDRYHQSRRL